MHKWRYRSRFERTDLSDRGISLSLHCSIRSLLQKVIHLAIRSISAFPCTLCGRLPLNKIPATDHSFAYNSRWILSRSSWQRERLSASMLSICSAVCLFFCLSPKCKNTLFSQKLSNLELWCLLTTYRKSYMGFQNTHYWTPKIQDGWDTLSWKSKWRHFFLPRVVRFG